MLARADVPKRHLRPLIEQPHERWVAAAERLRAGLGTGFLYALLGDRGTGKTRLAAATIRECIRRTVKNSPDTNRPAWYRKTLDLFLDVRASFKSEGKTEREVLAPYLAVDLLVLDEIQERGGTDFEDRMLTYVIDKRYDANKDTLLISNLKAGDFGKHVGPSIVDRLRECGAAIHCDWASFRGTPHPREERK
jgi:DNA replication protein DnaC